MRERLSGRPSQIRIRQRRVNQQIIRWGESRVFHGRDKRKMHAQIAVGRLSAPQRAVRRGHDHVRVLKISGKRRHRQHKRRHHRQLLSVCLRHALQFSFAAQAIAGRHRRQQQDDCRAMCKQRKANHVRAQRRQLHEQQHAKRKPQPAPDKRTFFREKAAHDQHAAGKEQSEIKNRCHVVSVLRMKC